MELTLPHFLGAYFCIHNRFEVMKLRGVLIIVSPFPLLKKGSIWLLQGFSFYRNISTMLLNIRDVISICRNRTIDMLFVPLVHSCLLIKASF